MGSVRKQIFMAVVMLAAAFAARGQDLERATLLVATAANRAVNEGTLLIAAPSNDGHIGFIVNHSNELKVVRGAEALQSTYAMVRRDAKRNDVVIGVVVDASRRTMDRIVRESADEARYFASLAAWPEGRLQQEVDAGLWIVKKPDQLSFFDN